MYIKKIKTCNNESKTLTNYIKKKLKYASTLNVNDKYINIILRFFFN